MEKTIAFYLGKDKENQFTGYIAEGNILMVVSIQEGVAPEKGRQFLQEVKELISENPIESLSTFEAVINECITKYNLDKFFISSWLYKRQYNVSKNYR